MVAVVVVDVKVGMGFCLVEWFYSGGERGRQYRQSIRRRGWEVRETHAAVDRFELVMFSIL